MSNNAPEDKTIEPKETLPQYKEYNEFTNKFTEFTHAYIHDNIGRADQKATIIFSFLTLIFLFLFEPKNWGGKTPFFLLQDNSDNVYYVLVKVVICIMIFSFAFSIILSFSTVFPRLKVKSYSSYDDSSNLLYWESILKNYTLKEYTTNIKNRTPDDLVQIKLEHCYEISLICKKKHKTLQLSMIAAVSGVIFFLVVQFLIAYTTK